MCRHVSIWGFQTVSVCPYPEKRNHLIFVNISPKLVIDTSLERSSRVLGTAWKVEHFFFLKRLKLNFDCDEVLIVFQNRSYSSKWSINQQHRNPLFFKMSKLNYDLCGTAYWSFSIGPTRQDKPNQLQNINNINILRIFIFISPLLSHNFITSQVATYAVYWLLIACQQNW